MEMMPTSQLELLSDRISSLRQKSKILSGNSQSSSFPTRNVGGRVNNFPSIHSREFFNYLIIKATRRERQELVGSLFDGNTDLSVSWTESARSSSSFRSQLSPVSLRQDEKFDPNSHGWRRKLLFGITEKNVPFYRRIPSFRRRSMLFHTIDHRETTFCGVVTAPVEGNDPRTKIE
ncbi:glycoside hydrolase [Anopheles sinensis]|uniref:Glycoside hydrolase n=1 Tax=Anopheles sinensis TaxID=74873 RepID=A0A084W8A0_ANOSI|nr:glycoside hydrolase [Anopheles sinensis]